MMLTPQDKISKKGNNIIQVVITRNCDIFNCSNCTQLLPFRKDNVREMSLECIEKVLINLKTWTGTIACFGGNPVTHSKFPQVCELWKKYVPDQRQRGLWTNNLLKYGPVIKDTFWPNGVFNLNVHGDMEAYNQMHKWLPGIKVWGSKPSHHAAVLGNHKDFNVSETEWEYLRERCDINQNWSAGIYQREDGNPYAYFCEVAGAIDGVTKENNGIPLTEEWWKLPISNFQKQIDNCCDKHCVVPLRIKGHEDIKNHYSISSSERLLTVGYAGHIAITDVDKKSSLDKVKELTDYQGLRS